MSRSEGQSDLVRVALRVVDAARVEAAAMNALVDRPSAAALQAVQDAHLAELDAVQELLTIVQLHVRQPSAAG